MLIAGRDVDGIGLGTAQFAFQERDVETSVATILAALDAGVGLVDTALAYTREGVESHAEDVVARALRQVTGERPVVATKGGHWREGSRFPVDGRPETLRRHCETSLRTLQTDRVDLYQLHHVDPGVSLAESVGALEQLRRDGKIAAIGLSNVTIAQLEQALAIAPISTVQNQLSYGKPGDVSMAMACAQRGVGYLAYKVFDVPSGALREAASCVALRRGTSVQRILLAWLREQSPNIIPLVGASRPATIRDSAGLVRLSEEDRQDLWVARLQTPSGGAKP
jgi:aryl-alcohol dehydrogenase-like predicted oxidoreductase